MRTWLKDNGPAIGAFAGVIVALVAVLQLAVAGPMNRRFDDLRAMINQRFDQQNTYINERFDQQDKYMNARFGAVDQRFTAVDQRFDAVDQRFTAMDQRFDAMGQRIDRLTDEVSELRLLVTGIGERVSRNEGHIQIIREQLQTVGAPAP